MALGIPMIRFCLLSILLLVASPGFSTPPPPPEPIQQVVDRFESEHLPLCVSVIEVMRRNLSESGRGKNEKSLSVLDGYLRNMRSDDLLGLKRALTPPSDGGIDYWSYRVMIDLAGFRRVADQIVIESLVGGSLKADAEFLDLMKRFWESERYFSWRFGSQATPERRPREPNQRTTDNDGAAPRRV